MAAPDPLEREPTPAEGAMPLDRFYCIVRATGHKTAILAQQWPAYVLIDAQQRP
jgi:hypothetical protein